MIRTKGRTVDRFEPNLTQLRYLELLGGEELVGKREIVLKARQLGMSTLILALIFMDTVNHPNTYSTVIAHDTESTVRLFQMIQRFYENLPEHKRPVTEYANRREYTWPELGSTFFVGTAGARTFGRGSTINNLHCSEVAFWPDAEDLMTGLVQAVPEDGNIFMETTANGLGNYYYDEWQLAIDGKSVFVPRFFPWYENPEYSLECPDEFEATEEEIFLAERYGASDQQLWWRRKKILLLKDKFPQEYPIDPAEAFLVSGSPYFHRPTLSTMLSEVQPYDPVSVLEKVPQEFPRLRSAVLKGELEIYRMPESSERYVIGADTAEGLDKDGVHDFDSADVLSVSEWEQVAHLHGIWDTREYGLVLAELGRFYQTALLAVERNNHGHAVLNTLIYEAEYPQQTIMGGSGIYYHEEYDEKKRLKSRKPGWPTTPKTKFFALDGLASSVESFDITVNSARTIGEMMTFVKLPGGKAGGEGKSHDDRVMSLAIADAVLKARPKVQPVRQNSALYDAFWGDVQ